MNTLCQCLEELWSEEDEEVAMVKRMGQRREDVSYAKVYKWIQTLKLALDGESEWQLVALNLLPFSIEETSSMLLVAQQRHWSYIPVDSQLSITRQVFILRKARVQQLVTTQNSPLARFLMEKRNSSGLKAQTVELTSSPFDSVQVFKFPDNYFDTEEDSMRQRLQIRVKEEDTAPLYLLFTSGTTGEPRGVFGSRVGTYTRLKWMWTNYPFVKPSPDGRTSERVLRATKLSFVDSVWEILGAFLQRVPLIHLQQSQVDGDYLNSIVLDYSNRFLQVMKSEQVTRFTAVPSVLEVLQLQTSESDRQSSLTHLRYIVSSGESLSLQLLQQLTATAPAATILNLYGSTELSGDVTCVELKAPLSPVQIAEWQLHGVPIAKLDIKGVVGDETSLLLMQEKRTTQSVDGSSKIIWPRNQQALDDCTDKVPFTGLLYVSGPLVTPGYADGIQEDVFMSSDELLSGPSDVEKHSKRWFCTGDICSVAQGFLYFCGRKDSAVKIHGQRVYLEAVERAVATALNETAIQAKTNELSVRNSHVIAFTTSKEVTKYGLLQQCIVACIIRDDVSGTAPIQYPQARELKTWITEHYGSSHTPHQLFVVSTDSVQRLSHGKIDRLALKDLFTRKTYADNNTKMSMANSDAKSTTEDRLTHLLKEILGLSLSQNISEDMRFSTFSEMGGNSLLATLFVHELRKEFDVFSLTGQDLLHMKIGSLLSSINLLNKRLRTVDNNIVATEMDAECELMSSSILKRQKKTHSTHSDGSTGNDFNDCTNLQTRLNFVSRYNQSSMSINGMYIPTCYISALPSTHKVSTSWKLRNAWQIDLEKCIDASPLVVQRRNIDNIVDSTWAIIGSHSAQLVCVDVQDAGKEIWRVKLDDRIEACAVLSVRHEIVYIGTYAGTFFALELQSGNTRWVFHTKGIIKASAQVIDKFHLVVCGSYDNFLYGLDTMTGKSQWVVDLQGSIFSTPLYCVWSSQLFAASTNGNIVAIKSGNNNFSSIMEEWRLQLPAPVFAGLNADYTSKKLLVGCADGSFYGLDMATGVIHWQVATEKPIFSSPCVYYPGSVVFGSHDGKLRKIDCQSGKLVWACDLHSALFASPTVVRLLEAPLDYQHNNCIDTEESGTLVCCITTTTGQLYFCDEETGSIIYQSNSSSGKAVNGANSCKKDDLGPLFGSPVVVDNWCLLGTRTNHFFGFKFTSRVDVGGKSVSSGIC